MLSKTILLDVSIFRCGSERSVHGRPSWELAPYDHKSEQTKDFTPWFRDASTECCFDHERAGECGVVCFMSQFFVLDKSKSISDCRGERDMESDETGENHEIPLDLEEEGEV